MSQESANPSTTIRVLLIEDNPADALLFTAMLAEPGAARFEVARGATLAEGLACLGKNSFDIILLDLSLPDSFGLETFGQVNARASGAAIIVMSGLDDENAAVNAVHAGAQDYLVKGHVDCHLLTRSVRYAIERHRAEAALRQSEAFYQSLVENLPQFILRKDLQGRFTFGNKKFLAELGMTLEQFVGKTDFDFFPRELAEKYQRDDHRVIETGEIFETVEEHEPPGGGKRYVQVVKTPIRDRDGKAIGIQGIFWDVTERRIAEEQIKKANWELGRSREDLLKAIADLRHKHNELKQAQVQIIQMERMQMVGRLAAGVAHGVKDPLASLSHSLNDLASLPALHEGRAAEVLRDMNDAIQRADAIIVGLLDFSSPAKLELTPASLNEILDDALRSIRGEIKSGKHEIEKEFYAALPPVLADSGKLKQVFVNLLTNALNAMPDGGTLTVRTRLREDRPPVIPGGTGKPDTSFLRHGELALVVEIEDTGTGIPPEKLTRIFEPFFAGKGTGLGLTVTKKIIELHGGTLSIQNRRGAGVRATVLLKTAGSAKGPKAPGAQQ
ncbi:MAG: PAS domain-containing protein [Verrucomicrobia bacterium]|nr:PAS domain-containing protein [Verrucomicrobiota bacterium]